MSGRKAGAAKTYGRFVALAAAMTCAAFHVVFLVEILLSVDVGSIRDRTGLAGGLLTWPRLGARSGS